MSILDNLLAYSGSRLSTLKASRGHKISGVVDDQVVASKDVEAGQTLADLATRGTKEPEFAPRLLKVVLLELAAQKEVPVLLAIDSVQALYRPTKYRDASFNQLDSFALSVPRLLLEFTSGSKKLVRLPPLVPAEASR